MSLVLKGLVKLVDFNDNKNFRNDAVIAYLSVLVKNKVLEPFLEAFKKYEDVIQNVITFSSDLNDKLSCRVRLEKVQAIINYRDEVMHQLSCVR